MAADGRNIPSPRKSSATPFSVRGLSGVVHPALSGQDAEQNGARLPSLLWAAVTGGRAGLLLSTHVGKRYLVLDFMGLLYLPFRLRR